MKNPILIIVLIICAVLVFSFYKAEKRKESFENIPVIEGKVLEPSDLYREGKQNDSEALSSSQENNNEIDTSDIVESKMEREQNYSDQENKAESNDDERTLTCQYCDDDFKQKKVTASVMGTRIETWSGGTNHCDPNWSTSDLSNLNLSGISKYCSRKCACEAGED
jgi:FtsZ-interacting cell division protein ZipA